MLFSELVKLQLEAEMLPIVDNLLEIKMNTPKVGICKRIDPLNSYIDIQMEQIQKEIDAIKNNRFSDWDKLNKVFLAML